MAALVFRRAAALGAASSAVAIGGALASYLEHLRLAGVLIFIACVLHVLARAYAKRARSFPGFQ